MAAVTLPSLSFPTSCGLAVQAGESQATIPQSKFGNSRCALASSLRKSSIHGSLLHRSALHLEGFGKASSRKGISIRSADEAPQSERPPPFSGIANLFRRSPGSSVQEIQQPTTFRGQGAERSYIMIKPDGVQRGLVGEIITRFEKKGFTLKGLKLFATPEQLAMEHYRDLRTKSFFRALVSYIISGPVVAMVWEGTGVVAAARKIIGATNPLSAEPGTIRGDLAVQTGRNVVHGSDSIENAEREINLWFKQGEVIEWTPTITPWLQE